MCEGAIHLEGGPLTRNIEGVITSLSPRPFYSSTDFFSMTSRTYFTLLTFPMTFI